MTGQGPQVDDPSSGSEAKDGWVALCHDSDVKAGEIFVAQAGSREIAVVRFGDEVFAVDAICTHALGYLDEGELDGCEIECPLHGARFDVRTGKPTAEPAEIPLRTYPVKSEDGEIYVQID